jgi:two-component system, chemotaxis family, chemotaxis protein CheY
MARITIADDYEPILILMQRVIENYGHQVVAVSANGRDAFRSYKDNTPDIAILDYRMPILNGIEVAQLIKADDSKAKVILCTANYTEVMLEAAELGVPVLAKPFHLEKLIGLIDETLAR